MADLQGRIALVTGASQGIGRACALELARAGATLAVTDINEVKLADVAAETTLAATAPGVAARRRGRADEPPVVAPAR